MDNTVISTIGYSGFGNDIETFIHSLHFFGINALIDVRSTPYSWHVENKIELPLMHSIITLSMRY